MTTERKEQVQVIRDGDYAQRRRVVEYAPSTQDVVVSRVTQFLWLIVTAVVALIGFRFVFALIGANPANNFVEAIYNITDVFVSPFNGIISTPDVTNGGVFDMAAVFAIFVYFIAAWLVIILLKILFSPTSSYRRSTRVEVES